MHNLYFYRTVRPQRRFGGFGPSTSAPAPPSTCSSCMG